MKRNDLRIYSPSVIFCFKFILSSLRILKPSRKGIEENEMEKKRQWLLTTTLFISLGLAACGSQSVLSQADANTQTTTKTSTTSTTQTASYFEASDLTATYDESKASKISLQGTTATVSGDGIHSDNEDDVLLGNIYLTNTKITVNAGDDGINASNTMLIDEGATIDVQKSEEGLEARLIHQVGGTVTVKSSDDGLNAKDWTLESSEGQGPGQQTKTVKAEAANVKNLNQAGEVKIVIDGGTLTVDAEGDGLDANGSIEINGGTVVVNGPTSGANAALDYDDNGKLNGGTVLFVDNGEMTMGFGSDSSQAFLMVSVQGTAGTTVEVVDSSGKTVASLKASKAFSTVLISSPEIKEGEKYTIKVGSNSTTATASKQTTNTGGRPGQGGPGGGQPGQGGRPGGR